MKPSGIEWAQEIPVEWKVKPLFAVGRESRVSNAGGKQDNLLSLSFGEVVEKDINSNDGLLPESFDTYQIIKPNDLVFRFTDLQNDKRSLRSALSNHSGIITSAYMAFTPRGCEPRFLAYLMRSYDLTKVFYAMGSGLRQSLKYSDVKRLPIILPPINEQRAIADFLDRETLQIDNLIAKQEQLISTLRERSDAFIAETVTRGMDRETATQVSPVAWLDEVPAHWNVSRVRFVCEITTGFGDTQDASENGQFPFYVRSEFPLQSDSFDFEGDAVLTAGDGAGVGKVFHLVSGPFKAHQRVYVMRMFRGILPAYFFYFFSSMFARVALDGSAKSTVDSLRRPMLANLNITIPPISEQREIVTHLDDEVAKMQSLSARATEVIALLKERRQALISAAVTGKISVGA